MSLYTCRSQIRTLIVDAKPSRVDRNSFYFQYISRMQRDTRTRVSKTKMVFMQQKVSCCGVRKWAAMHYKLRLNRV